MSDVTELLVRGVVVGLFRENCWIIGSRRTGEAVVVDPGDEPEEILALARDMGVRITRIVCSHAHLDHLMAVGAIKERTGAPFLLHPHDLGIAAKVPQAAALWLGRAVPPPPPPDALLAEGDDLEIAGVQLRVLHTPGHTQGSISLYGAGLLFSGDTLFRGSIGRTDLEGGNGPQLMQTIVDKLLQLPDDTVVLPGHMAQTTIGHERRTNPFILAELRRRRGE
ncbi:MAG TPA: MBL fold metallo-hydrolase [Chloroflexota bacterium]|jgi:hydroxyacylglutathione hydrolase|nr:MBL fold metallo-hydrolase [Chloroflexota bacterium]